MNPIPPPRRLALSGVHTIASAMVAALIPAAASAGLPGREGAFAPTWTAVGPTPTGQFGESVAHAGDVNGDGYDDIVVGMPGYENGQAAEGAILVYLGSPAGLGATAAATIESDIANSSFGTVAAAGDVNGDGYDDVIVGAFGAFQSAGRAFLYLGSATGVQQVPAWTVDGGQTQSLLGYAVAGAGDVNGDGFADVIVGSPQYDVGGEIAGRADVYLGSPAGLALTPAWTAYGPAGAEWYGRTVAGAGDVNGDGYGDILVGDPNFDGTVQDEGAAYLYLGSPGGPGAAASWSAHSAQLLAHLGESVAGAGDLNGDGFADVAIGVPGYDSALSDAGEVLVYFGSPSGLGASPGWTAVGSQRADEFGALVVRAGDVDADGYDDLLAPADLFDSAGRVDNGAVAVYFGSPAGLPSTPGWLAVGARSNANLGVAVAGGGDVNHDGFADILASAAVFNRPIGRPARGLVLEFNGGSNMAAPSAPERLGAPPLDAFVAERANAAGTVTMPCIDVPRRSSDASLVLRYSTARAGRAQLAILDARGVVCAIIDEGKRSAGHHVAGWNGRDVRGFLVPRGVYWARLETQDRLVTRKFIHTP